MELGLSLGLGRREEEEDEEERSSNDLQLSLLPFAHENKDSSRGLDVNISILSSASEAEDGTARAVSGSPNSDEEENLNSRKKLRLSKEQSAFLEDSFKEHTTLNPKQKVALAKQLNLRPRQVEVWFQNRRARTKLKQTEVDCEYLKRCCETLTEENRRLQKELSELRALKAPLHPFSMQLPATTLSMCPSCERTITTTTAPSAANPTSDNQNGKSNAGFGSLFAASKPQIYPFTPRPATSPAS